MSNARTAPAVPHRNSMMKSQSKRNVYYQNPKPNPGKCISLALCLKELLGRETGNANGIGQCMHCVATCNWRDQGWRDSNLEGWAVQAGHGKVGTVEGEEQAVADYLQAVHHQKTGIPRAFSAVPLASPLLQLHVAAPTLRLDAASNAKRKQCM